MIAEATGHDEAMDLYRHSTQLGFHPEGALGYSSMVLYKLLTTADKSDKDFVFSIKNMNAEVLACDALTWYTGKFLEFLSERFLKKSSDRYPNNACAFNMHGLLLERLRLYRSSAEALDCALQVNSEENADQIRINYGRVLNQLDQTKKSVEIIKGIKNLSFESQCVLAVALVKDGQLPEAYKTYENLLESLAENDEQKSHILVAMAGVLYQHQGFDDAKFLLMQA